MFYVASRSRDQDGHYAECTMPAPDRPADVVPLDESAARPDIRPATLTLSVQRPPGHRMSLSWEWVAVVGVENHQ